jgi:hypothetical protein
MLKGTDGSQHVYVEVDNVRLTFVPASDRSEAKDWAGKDVIRIQAHQANKGNALHMGAEFPVGGVEQVGQLVSAICQLYLLSPNT